MPFLTLGVVSNGWADLLKASTLEEQCRRAVEAGYRYVELRQRALGECEEAVPGDDRPWPVPGALAELPRAVPALRFNLAVEAPFLTRTVSADEPYIRRCVEAALAVGGDDPVLRLVDLSPAPALLEHEEAIDELGCAVGELTGQLARQQVRLALENSKQPVSALRAVIRRAAFTLPERGPVPQICWDPANQAAQKLRKENPAETAQTLAIEELFEFHFKQVRDGEPLVDVREGDVDFRAILTALRARGYRGPALFEIPPGPDIWDRLGQSTGYITSLIHQVEGSA
jgi:sugar phosphate isomerase/epimerase